MTAIPFGLQALWRCLATAPVYPRQVRVRLSPLAAPAFSTGPKGKTVPSFGRDLVNNGICIDTLQFRLSCFNQQPTIDNSRNNDHDNTTPPTTTATTTDPTGRTPFRHQQHQWPRFPEY
ncbi:uncharacterized protein SPSK_01309 [Sporothrix schenckii 1099-18]|uniref:Uncharacterized protein n=1 Tax=Sporothrix schenckii 1099-18 TaxID=1397361 RepID=A0A0F2LV82_SPOSC|nr:uncharacterized protein SPSK_01309 [Sporothrix schenckii 1099-18]KJR81372.1 hypothetical protein SPSK_01309 [Sporothrix schenckii 1099-18]